MATNIQRAVKETESKFQNDLFFDSAILDDDGMRNSPMGIFIQMATRSGHALSWALASAISCAPVGTKSYTNNARRNYPLALIIDRKTENECEITLRSPDNAVAASFNIHLGEAGLICETPFKKVDVTAYIGTVGDMQKLFTNSLTMLKAHQRGDGKEMLLWAVPENADENCIFDRAGSARSSERETAQRYKYVYAPREVPHVPV